MIARERKAKPHYINTRACWCVSSCVFVCVCNMCLSKYSCMHALLSELYSRVFRLEETENGVKVG